ncbi:hypothetical protein ACFQMB_07125 [Pseudobowmanella zhangzhouensis]|uniref:hypothetical protein n=1 Tax=Pseudobowmanella zhangzhouensis TaxID=1537679 RepID=UPI0036099823
MGDVKLALSFSRLSDVGGKAVNEDAVASAVPDDAHLLTYKGACFALADGVSTAEATSKPASAR